MIKLGNVVAIRDGYSMHFPEMVFERHVRPDDIRCIDECYIENYTDLAERVDDDERVGGIKAIVTISNGQHLFVDRDHKAILRDMSK